MKVDAEYVKQLILREFKKQKTDPPQWIDWMTIVVYDKINREIEKVLLNPWARRKKINQIIDEVVKDAVMWYIDTIDLISTTRAEIESEE